MRPVRLVNGEEVDLALAERGVRLSNGLWVREVRQRDEKGHQTAMLATDYISQLDRVAAALFARWCQENFFQYMGVHYGLDQLIEYGTEPLPDATEVVNPAWRRQDQEIRRQKAALVREHAQFGALQLPDQSNPQGASDFEQRKGQLLERIEQQQKALDELKRVRKETPKHVLLKDLPEAERFTQLRTSRKHFVDTIKLIAYRAETALVRVAREKLQREDDARALVRQIFGTAVDLQPDLEAKTLTVRLHCLSTEAHQAVLQHLCGELNSTETTFPGTELRLVFAPIWATEIPRGQDP